MEQVFDKVNKIFQEDKETRKRKLRVRTYSAVPLGPKAGVIEFVPDSKALFEVISPYHQAMDTMKLDKAREMMKNCQTKEQKERLKVYRAIEAKIKPVLKYFFLNNFSTPESWFASRQIYIRGVATTSIVGHILGLGDRHCNNILLDEFTGEPIHIDLGVAFDQGKRLKIPETIPFRLTRDIVDGFGYMGTTGSFSKVSEHTFRVLRASKDHILAILDVLRWDPLYSWSISPIRKRKLQEENTDILDPEANQDGSAAGKAILGVSDKLSAGGLSVEAAVRELIREASSEQNLAVGKKENAMSNGKVISISLDVFSRSTERKVKTASAQVKVVWENEGQVLYLLAACEEGMFEGRFTSSKIKKAKVKQDLRNDDWEDIMSYLFNSNLMEEKCAPAGFDNVTLKGRLTSSEEYDAATGELIGDDLSSLPPDFELSVRTDDLLAVEYGSMMLRYKDVEESPDSDRASMNLLNWISEITQQMQVLQGEFFERKRRLEEAEAIIIEKNRAIEEMESDYKTILHDIEDRFFQVLQSKKRKIAQLEGDSPERFDMLNENYKDRQKSNLRILKLEDIVIGEGNKNSTGSGQKRKRGPRQVRAKSETRAEDFGMALKQEPVSAEVKRESIDIKDENDGGLFMDEANMEMLDTSIYNSPDFNADPGMVPNGSKSPSPVPASESGTDSASAHDSTDYSGSDDDEDDAETDHVRERASDKSASADSGEDGNETEYSD
ncbi:hypothetical protein JCM33374_g5926 [Metschnikowia sp. JCM 33374]|nr:hypothetical protein JCM33374_g5926 [Metschnikowia sp. JCM 33374]